jgi:apolipoprotein N-acyltransferase
MPKSSSGAFGGAPRAGHSRKRPGPRAGGDAGNSAPTRKAKAPPAESATGSGAPAGASGFDGLASPWALRRLIAILVLSSGLLLGLSVPGHAVRFAWVAAYLPLFAALDLALRLPAGLGARLLKTLACTWPVGVMMALVTGGWVVNTSYVFGGLPLGVAWGVNALGYGTLLGLEIFAFLGIPYLLTRGRFVFSLIFISLWSAVFQLYTPRFLFWTFGEQMHPVPQLVQAADVLGAAGLNLWLVPLQLLLLGWVRRAYAPGPVPRRTLWIATAVLAAAFAAGYGYGQRRLETLAAPEPDARHVHLVGIQPNFSLKELASNPELSPSDRQTSLRTLVSDTNAALLKGGVVPGEPTVVVWPESVYPVPYFDAPQARVQVEAWAQTLGVHLLLATIESEYVAGPDGRKEWRAFGAAVHIPPGGSPTVYHKMNLIPFGETIPFADLVPAWGRALKAVVPRISQFAAGHDPVVFKIADGLVLAPLICFDVADYRPALGMAGRGATVGILMGNLAWFGRSTATQQFEGFARFRAVENRMPILVLSQNGESVLIDERGEPASPRVGLFEVGALSVDVAAGRGSFYGRHGAWVNASYAAALAAAAAFGWGWPALRRRLQRRASAG